GVVGASLRPLRRTPHPAHAGGADDAAIASARRGVCGSAPAARGAGMSTRVEQGDRYRWVVVGMLWLVCFFNYADRQAIFSVFPLLREEMGLSNVQLGIVAGSFMWVYAAFGPIAGLIGDRLNRK